MALARPTSLEAVAAAVVAGVVIVVAVDLLHLRMNTFVSSRPISKEP